MLRIGLLYVGLLVLLVALPPVGVVVIVLLVRAAIPRGRAHLAAHNAAQRDFRAVQVATTWGKR